MEYKYKAFISYNHNERDSRVARLLHNRIETYTVPRKLRKNGKKKLGKVFRDQEELSASSDLNQHIRDALDESEFLIVICSPGAVASKWVSKEIAYFLEHHKQEKLLTVLTDGEERELFPALFPGLPEPLSLDLRRNGDLKSRFLKLCAPLLGCEYDELVMRDQKRRRRQMMWWMAGIAAVAAAIISILLWSYIRINAKNQEILLRESAFLTQEAQEALDAGDRATAIEKAIAALPSEGEDRPYYALAEQTLFSAIEPFSNPAHNYIFTSTVLEQNTAIVDFCISGDGKRLTTADQFTNLNCFDTVTGELLWSRQLQSDGFYRDPCILFCGLWDSILYCDESTLMALSQKTGELLWSAEDLSHNNNYLILSDDQKTLVTLSGKESDDWKETAYSLIFLSTEDGTVQSSYPITTGGGMLFFDSDQPRISFPELYPKGNKAAVYFTDLLFLGCYIKSYDDGPDTLHYFLIKLAEQTVHELYTRQIDSIDVYYMGFDPTDGTILFIYSDFDFAFSRRFIAEKIRLDTMTADWTSELHDVSLTKADAFYFDSVIMIRTDTQLLSLDSDTGEILATEDFDGEILDFAVLEDGTFVYLTEGGMYAAGWINKTGFVDTRHWGELFRLGSGSAGQLWNGGSPRIEIVGKSTKGFYMTDEDHGGGYAAMIPAENDHSIVLYRPHQIPEQPSRKTLELHIPSNSNRIQQAGDLYYVYGSGDLVLVVDMSTCSVVSRFESSEYLSHFDTLFLPDGTGCIVSDNNSAEYRDLRTGQTHTFFDNSSDGDQIWEGYRCRSGRLSGSGDVLTAILTESGLRIYINGQHHKDAAFSSESMESSSFNLTVGSNGYILLYENWGRNLDGYLIYDYYGDTWHHIPNTQHLDQICRILLGSETPTLFEINSDGDIRVCDISTRKEILRFRTGLQSSTIDEILLTREDSLLIIYTMDQDINIFDLNTGSLVYSEQAPENYQASLVCYDDPQNEYLFLFDNSLYNNGLCMSTVTWNVLMEIPEFLLYDCTQKVILQYASDDDCSLTLSAIPTTEELIALGKQFLGE